MLINCSCLQGMVNRNKREYMYRLMLEQMTDVDKLQVTQVRCLDGYKGARSHGKGVVRRCAKTSWALSWTARWN